MARRRGNHEGSIHQLPSGTYRAQITLQGQRLSFTASTRKQCQEWLKQTYRQIDDGLSLTATKITLGEYMSNWLSTTKSAIRHTTWVHYEQVTRCYIVPWIGQLKIRELRPEHIQGLYISLQEQGVGAWTIQKIHGVLHSALGYALKLGMIGRNPISIAQPPKAPAKEMTILNESQVNQLLVIATAHRWQALFHLAIATGAREMELLGLRWNDLDWVRQTLKVERQLVRPNGNGVQFSAPKTRFGKRSIALGSKTIDVLRMHYERQQTERLAAGEQWEEYDLIFTTSNGTPIHPRNLLRDFKKLLKETGLSPIRFHDLRHTAASLMLNHNVPPIVVSRRLGHAKASITLDVYGHLIPSLQTEAAEMIDDLITPISLTMQNLEVEE